MYVGIGTNSTHARAHTTDLIQQQCDVRSIRNINTNQEELSSHTYMAYGRALPKMNRQCVTKIESNNCNIIVCFTSILSMPSIPM